MKTCSHCKVEKSDNDFAVRQSVCRKCQSDYHKRKRQEMKLANPDNERRPAKIDPMIGQVLRSRWI